MLQRKWIFIATLSALVAACSQNKMPQNQAAPAETAAPQSPAFGATLYGTPTDDTAPKEEKMWGGVFGGVRTTDAAAGAAAPSPAPQATLYNTWAQPMTAKRVVEVEKAPASSVVLYGRIMGGMEYSQPENTEKYGKINENPIKSVAQEPISTFSADVDTGSYANVRRFINNDRLPQTDAVRVEELLNYFDYGYATPNNGKPFAVHTETLDSPWQPNAKLLKIAIKAKEVQTQALPPANLVFLVDVSGSMSASNKLPLVKKTLSLLTERLRPEDKVTLITYASGERVVLPPTSGKDKQRILDAIAELEAGGSTNGEQALRRAYAEAEKAYIKNGINRILLATDGDFNVGMTNFDALKDFVAEKRKSGVSLSTLGYGTDNYNEHLMEQAADAGDGNYSYIDNEQEAKKVLQRQLSSTLTTVAQDVKIQVEFNPATVKEYRLVGYENRLLNQEDFNNDKVDAGDIGAGHSVTALYEIVPVGEKGWLDESRYQAPAKVSGSLNEYAFVKLRYKNPNEKHSILLEQAIPVGSKTLAQSGSDTRWAVAVAAYGQQLRGGKYNGKMDWDGIYKLAHGAAAHDPFGERAEFLHLLKKAQNLSSKQP